VSTYAAHLSEELLSAYLDGELKETKAERVEQHLEACSGCRARMDGLRRVVHSLARLERAAPPPILAQRVERRIALEGRDASLVERLENRLQGLRLDSPLVATFAVVLALGVIIYAFSHQVAHHRGDVSLQVAPPEAVEGLMAEFEAVEIDGRHLARRGEAWVETGLGEAEAGQAGAETTDDAAATATEPEIIAYDSPRGVALRTEHPWVEELLTLTGAGAVEFRDAGGAAVRVERWPTTDGAGGADGAEAGGAPAEGKTAPAPAPTPAPADDEP